MDGLNHNECGKVDDVGDEDDVRKEDVMHLVLVVIRPV
jgi:hypothetical protein